MAIISERQIGEVAVVHFESDHLIAQIAPLVGGRIVSLVEKSTGHEFLWRNPVVGLRRLPLGSEYDPNFFGGIDELLPNDVPETVDGVAYPDHGELWTTPFDWSLEGDAVVLEGRLPYSGLAYRRTVSLSPDGPLLQCDYRIFNPTNQPRHFLWKLHAAMAIEADDIVDCPANHAQVVDPEWSRISSREPFDWPTIAGTDVSRVPPKEGTIDFFYLFDLQAGRMAWRRPAAGLRFEYRFDLAVFPFAWLFASYGGFCDHYTLVLEPCTTMPYRVSEAIRSGMCSRLSPEAALETVVQIYAGPENMK